MARVIVGLPQLLGRMDDLAKKQAPFALAKAMTTTVRQAKAAEDAHILATFDNPTPFTKRAVAFTPATKANLKASVFVKDLQAKYLQPEADGGRRQFKTFEERFATDQIALPARGVKLNQYGNVSKAQIKRIAANLNKSGKAKRYFMGVPKGSDLPMGIYARDGKKIVPLLVFATEAVYKQRFRFNEVGVATITAQFEPNFAVAWSAALATARP